MKEIPIVTIDGPSSSGKGSISRPLAKKLGWHFLDSGAIYRVLALVVSRRRIPLDDVVTLATTAKNLKIKFVNYSGLSQKIFLESEDVTSVIRQEEYGIMASKIASIAEVRAALIAYQQSFCRSPGLVADGRDMGTVVFPQARLKIFLTADLKERARRRLRQLQDQGINATLSTIFEDLAVRDKRDCERLSSPLKPAAAAVVIDTTKLSIDEVLQQVYGHVKNVYF